MSAIWKKSEKKRKKNIPRAQTTPDASFGPIFVLAVKVVVVVVMGLATHRLEPHRCHPQAAVVIVVTVVVDDVEIDVVDVPRPYLESDRQTYIR